MTDFREAHRQRLAAAYSKQVELNVLVMVTILPRPLTVQTVRRALLEGYRVREVQDALEQLERAGLVVSLKAGRFARSYDLADGWLALYPGWLRSAERVVLDYQRRGLRAVESEASHG